MALNFPNSPADGDLATLNGTTFQYNAAKNLWDPVTEELTTTSDTPPGSPSNGQTWFDTTNGTLYVYYDDGTSSQWVGVTGPQGENATGGGTSGNTGSSSSSVTTYSTISELPLIGNTTGDQAFVSGNNRLYLWNGNGWYNIALINTAPTITGGGAGSYDLATDGTPTVITLTATDPEELPITWTYSVTSGSLTNGGGVTATVSQADNVFTITPTTTEAYAGTFSLTFTASDGVNIATDVNSFTLDFVTIVADSNYTSYLLKANASAADNQVDASSNSLTITENGNVTSTAFTPYHPKGYSTYFDGSGDYLVIGDGSNTGYIELSGDFTIEAFIWSNGDFSSQNNVIGSDLSYEGNYQVYISSTFNLSIYDNSTAYSSTGTIPQNEWAHIAITRSGSTVTYWINGSSAGTSTLSTTLKYRLVGGLYRSVNPVIYNSFDGYISNVRIVDGTAIYTSTFTPPIEALTNVTNTAWLVCHLPYLADGSSNGYSVTSNGDARTVQFGPYDHEKYTPSSHGGSVYFDGSGDYLTATQTNEFDFGTGDFTIDFWYYPTAHKNYSEIWDTRTGQYTTGGTVIYTDSSGNIYFYVTTGTSGTTAITGGPLVLNAWSHVEVSRSSGSTKMFINGVQSGSTYSDTNDYTNPSTATKIGTDQSAGYSIAGYLSDFRVINGTALNTSNFTPPTTPVTAVTNTQLLTCTNKHEVWDAASGDTLTFNGSAGISTSQTKFASSNISISNTVSGDTDYLQGTFPDLGDGDYTMELWLYFNSIGGQNDTYTAIVETRTNGSSDNPLIWEKGGVIAFYQQGWDIEGTTTLTTNTWYHVALTRESGTSRLFLNGTLEGSTTSTETYGASNFELGLYNSNYGLDGYIEDFRITRGFARYTANFTPPTGSLEG
jgi:hypothetical protein